MELQNGFKIHLVPIRDFLLLTSSTQSTLAVLLCLHRTAPNLTMDMASQAKTIIVKPTPMNFMLTPVARQSYGEVRENASQGENSWTTACILVRANT